MYMHIGRIELETLIAIHFHSFMPGGLAMARSILTGKYQYMCTKYFCQMCYLYL